MKRFWRTGQVPAIHLEGEHRDLRLDACRGLALWFIFIDHIPGNAFEWLTLRNYGFSDATEVFVFVSGYTCMLAYGGALREQGWQTIMARSLRRGSEIYAAFLLLVIAYLALIRGACSGSFCLDETNTRFFFENPGEALIHVTALQYTPVNTDILPTFVMLHLAFPLVLWLLIRNALVALGASFLLYLMVQIYGWNLPAWPSGELYFNPLAWQFLFVFGAWYAGWGAGRLKGIMRLRATLLLAVFYIVFGLIVTLSWRIEPLKWLIPDVISTDLSDLQEPPRPGAAPAFSGVGRPGLALHTAGLAWDDPAVDGGDDPLRRELAADLLLQCAAVISCLRDFEAGFRRPGNAGRRQRGRDRADNRGCKFSDVGSQARSPRAEAVLGANRVLPEMSRPATGLRSSAAMPDG